MSRDNDKHESKDAPKDAKTEQSGAAADKAGQAASRGQAAGHILNELSRKNAAGTAKARRQGRSMGGLLVFIVMLPFLAAALFLAWQQYLLQNTLVGLRQENQRLAADLSAQSGTLASLREQMESPVTVDTGSLQEADAVLEEVDVALEEINAELQEVDAAPRDADNELESELASLRRDLEQLASRERVGSAEPDYGWRIREAAFLVRQAELQLELRQDPAMAIDLLQMADTTLAESGQSGGFFEARQALSADLASLRALPSLDREETYLRLDSLASDLGEVDLLESMRSRFERRRSAQSEPIRIGETESGLLDTSLALIRQVFVWRRWDEQPGTMLTAGQESVLKQTLRLQVKQAQLALLERDAELYRRSLDECEVLLERYAVNDSSAGHALLAELHSLRQLQIEPPLPDLEQSSRAIQQLLASD